MMTSPVENSCSAIDADDGGADEDELHQVAVLAQKRLPAWLLLRLRELVRADLLTTPIDLGSLEPARRVDAELRARFLRRHAVPHGRGAGSLRTRHLSIPTLMEHHLASLSSSLA